MTATDSEDLERIAKHRQERDGLGFTTIEQPLHIENILINCYHTGSFLLDSLTALMSNEMFSVHDSFDNNAYARVSAGLIKVLANIQQIVIVSDYIYSDSMLYNPFIETYRESLAALDRLTAKHCDVVLEAAYTQIIVHKGNHIFRDTFHEIS